VRVRRLGQSGQVGDDVLQLRGAAHGHDHLAPPGVRGHEEGGLVVRPRGRQLDVVERKACAARGAPVRPGAPAAPSRRAVRAPAEPRCRAAPAYGGGAGGQSPYATRPLQRATRSI
jgi:hypothetical protein